MKKSIIVLLIILLAKISAFSLNTSIQTKQDSILISTTDLKYANLIFNEHRKLLKENNLLNQQINNYKEEINLLSEVDSIRISQIRYKDNQIDDLNKIIKKENRVNTYWKIGSITVVTGLILFLFLK